MSTLAKAYIACVTTLGLGLLLAGLIFWSSADPARFVIYLVLGLVASTWKVKLPGITGSISGSFLFILIGISAFSFSETVVLASAAAVVQSFWRVKKNPLPVQVAFNVAALSASASAGWFGGHGLLRAFGSNSLILLLVPAACIFFVADTGLVSGVIALVERKSFLTVWRECNGWSFPYYLLGAVLAGLIAVSSRTTGWVASLFLVPAMYLVYGYYRFFVEKATQERVAVTVDDHEHEMVVSTR
jgi:hypothetical protein